jgi:formylglycine-generating enzyme
MKARETGAILIVLPAAVVGLFECGGRSGLEVDGDDSTIGLAEAGGFDAHGPQGDDTGGGSSSSGSSGSSGGDSAIAPPSCAPGGDGLNDCGALRESCCESIELPGGTFYRTYDLTANGGPALLAADGGPTGEADPATVSGFLLDKYDVTVGRFRQFVRAWNDGWTPPAGSGKHVHLNLGRGLVDIASRVALLYETGWVTEDNGDVAPTNANLSDAICDPGNTFATWTPSVGTQEKLPINCVTWQEAYAFCIWDGGFLPSQAEWEYAAAGGSQQREYPWGSADPGTASQYAIFNCLFPDGSDTCHGFANGVSNLAPVGSALRGAGRWGQLDLGGELLQWSMDWGAPYVVPCTDCAILTGSGSRDVGGSEFAEVVTALLPSTRAYGIPSDRNNSYGIRCARSP